ncbi:hypothetical protein, partial [Segatella oulorum]|uniref:hypothetical protein n=1 Tax=Segatella oulorum TaxID=28136 RepID=UPI0028E2058C
APAERLFSSKTVVPHLPNACFSQKRLFRTCRTLVFLKNGCSNPLERPFGLLKTKRACPSGHALSVSVIKECVLLFIR